MSNTKRRVDRIEAQIGTTTGLPGATCPTCCHAAELRAQIGISPYGPPAICPGHPPGDAADALEELRRKVYRTPAA